MVWNWQHSDWPNWHYPSYALEEKERQFQLRAGQMAESWDRLAEDDRAMATVDLLVEEAITTSLIEGEDLDRASVLSALRRNLGMSADTRRGEAERGIADMMVDGHQTWQEPLEAGTMNRWHRMVCRGYRHLGTVGNWRKCPVYVVSSRLGQHTVVFEAPPADRMPDEMQGFIDWYNATAPDGPNPLPALGRVGLAHIYFVTVHPYEDGNGRVTRALCDKALSQAVGQPCLASLSAQIWDTRSDYYRMLRTTNETLDVGDWMMWFADTVLEALERSRGLVDQLMPKTGLLNRLQGQINDRQTKALMHLYKEGLGESAGGLSAAIYMRITQASPATARRDLGRLVEMGALVRTGERKGTRYWLVDREKE